MQVARLSDGQIEPLYCQSETIYDVDVPIVNQEGMITSEGEERIISVLTPLKAAGDAYGATKCRAVATELFRRAKNGREIAKKISLLLDMEVKVISPEDEGILSFLTIIQEGNFDPDAIVVLDIGSGSFQITCKQGDRFLTFSAPFGRIPTQVLVKSDQLSILKAALSGIDPEILEKIQDCRNIVIGVGGHPKAILKSQFVYDLNDVIAELLISSKIDMNYTDLLLTKTIMESLSIKQITYRISLAGNTSGLFICLDRKIF